MPLKPARAVVSPVYCLCGNLYYSSILEVIHEFQTDSTYLQSHSETHQDHGLHTFFSSKTTFKLMMNLLLDIPSTDNVKSNRYNRIFLIKNVVCPSELSPNVCKTALLKKNSFCTYYLYQFAQLTLDPK